MILDDSIAHIWYIIRDYPILSSVVVHVFLTTLETFFLQLFFMLFDFEFWKLKRLAVYERIYQDKVTYMESIMLVLKNSALLWLGVAVLTFAVTGDIHGHYAIQGITRDRLPIEAPTFLSFVIQSAITIVAVDFGLYWMHRAFHVGFLYRKFHSVHHAYHDTIALHSMCAHIVEIYSALFLLFLIPRAVYECTSIHPLVVYMTPFIMTLHGVLEHCGYDDMIDTLTFGLFSGSKMHMVHHQISRKNFGFYTYLWDTLFGTKLTYENMETDILKRKEQ